MLKFEDNPPVLSPALASIQSSTLPWWVGHTKARFEKAMAWDLVKAEVAYFLPLVDRVKVSGGRKRRLMMPLFPGYIFFTGTPEARYLALSTDRLCSVIPVPDQDGLIRELSYLHTALQGQAELELYPFAVVGQRCRITHGAFMGIEGTIVERKKKARVVLTVGILGQGASLEVDLDAVEPVEDESIASSDSAGRRPTIVLRR